MDISVIILAAGEGTRMKSNKPKVLHKISGEAMLIHIIKKAKTISNDVRVVLGFGFDEVKNEIESKFDDILIFRQDTVNLPGTAGAVICATKDLKSKKTIITCGDMPLIDANELENLAKSTANLTLSAFESTNPFGYGRVITDSQKVVKIVEQKDASEAEKKVNLCNAGAYCFDTSLLLEILPQISNQNASKEYYLTDAVQIAIKMGKIVDFTLVNEENFMGVNDKFALSKAEIIMQNKIKENLMKNGVIMHFPDTIFVDSRAKFSGECEIEPNAMIMGECEIINSHIKAGSVIEDSFVQNSDIGPNAHLRPKSHITDTHIGNFVELKNAKLNGVKAGHLSYLGDCEIDSGTNIGCGTITCNYDGMKKYRTIIGKNVFVGSDTQFVAPVKIADNTIIAAGSTITKDSNEGDLLISRTRQSNIGGYFYKHFGKKDEK